MPFGVRRALARALILLSAIVLSSPAWAQYGLPAPGAGGVATGPCLPFTDFPLRLSPGTRADGRDGETSACSAGKIQASINALANARGVPNGIATLDDSGRLSISQLPPLSAYVARDVVFAADYGMVCDGQNGTDNGGQTGPLMQATLFAASQARDVVLPSGVCRINTFMEPPSGTHWIGRGQSTLYLDPGMTTGHPIGGVKNGIAFDSVSDIVIDGVTFAGAGFLTPTSSNCNTGSCARIAFLNANKVRIRNSLFRDFGSGQAYIQGLIAFGGSDWLVDASSFINTSGDNIAFSNSSTNVEVRGSYFGNSTGDSALVCTIGGANFNFHDNIVVGGIGNPAPIIVMDRCSNWSVTGNKVVSPGTATGVQIGQAIRVARYGNTAESNHDFTIANNNIQGADTAISVERSAGTQGIATVGGGGRFSVTGNTMTGPNTCIAFSDSEAGSVTGNTCVGAVDTGIKAVSYTAGENTGAVTISGNTISAANYGIHQVAGPGQTLPLTIGSNTITYATSPILLAVPSTAPYIPTGAPGAAKCQAGQIVGVDNSFLYVCPSFGVIGKVPLTTQVQ